MTWHILYATDTGQSVSIGTILAAPLPAGLTDRPLSDAEADALLSGAVMWDPVARGLVPTPPAQADPVEDALDALTILALEA